MKFEVEIDGEEIKIDHTDLEVKDIEKDSVKVASDVFSWGAISAILRLKVFETKVNLKQLEAQIKTKQMRENPKLAEWKISAMLEQSTEWWKIKTELGHWQKEYDQANAAYQAYITKATMIQAILKNDPIK
jgi:hypothetical protein